MRVVAIRLSGPVPLPMSIRLRRTFRCVRNGAARAQSVDFGRAESQLLEYLVVVLSDFRSALRGYLGDAMHLNRTADRRGQPFACALERNDDVIRSQLGIVDH